MNRTKLKLPESFTFRTEIAVRIDDINYGGHLGNDRVLTFMHQARIAFLKHHGMSETDACGAGLIMADAVIVYKSQAFADDILTAEVTAADFDKHGFDLYYRLTNKASGREVARAKTSMATFDYQNNKLVPVPPELAGRLGEGRAQV